MPQTQPQPSWARDIAERAALDQAERERSTNQAPPVVKHGDKLKAELDELLDEIDEVLEDNAQEFVRSYVQKGGQ